MATHAERFLDRLGPALLLLVPACSGAEETATVDAEQVDVQQPEEPAFLLEPVTRDELVSKTLEEIWDWGDVRFGWNQSGPPRGFTKEEAIDLFLQDERTLERDDSLRSPLEDLKSLGYLGD